MKILLILIREIALTHNGLLRPELYFCIWYILVTSLASDVIKLWTLEIQIRPIRTRLFISLPNRNFLFWTASQGSIVPCSLFGYLACSEYVGYSLHVNQQLYVVLFMSISAFFVLLFDSFIKFRFCAINNSDSRIEIFVEISLWHCRGSEVGWS